MYQKIKKIENYALALLALDAVLLLLLFFDFPLTLLLGILFILNCLCVYLIFKKGNALKEELKKSKNILPASVIKAVDIDEYCMMMYNESDKKVVWENEYFTAHFGSCLDKDVTKLFSGFLFEENEENTYLKYNDSYYWVIKNEETFLFKDVTAYVNIKNSYEEEKDCVLYIKVDSIDELSSSLDENSYQMLVQKVRQTIVDFTNQFDCLLRRYKTDSYIMVAKNRDLQRLLNEGMVVLDRVKETNEANEVITISMGVSVGFTNLKDAEKEAGSALEMALARGGDQIVVKEKNEEYKFYGKGSETIEKRSRVKVRTITSSLEILISKASNVVLMPHRNADLDALGACYGMAKFVELNDKDVYICSDPETLEANTKDAYYLLNLDEKSMLKTKEQVLSIIDKNTLLVVLDTSNYELLEAKEIYDMVDDKVIIDHHRRSQDLKGNPLLVYVESYASSTVELVTELLNFQNKSFKLNSDIATLMLAGMMVDTSYFTLRTGVRTFEAAMLLKDNGASPLQAKEILQVSRDTYQKKLEMVQKATYIDDEIAISKYSKEPVTRTLLAQVAVELLDVKDIVATFVIGILEDGSVGISARSNGDYNVQVILEKFGGGGHYSMAAAQLNQDINLVEKQLIIELKNSEKGVN